MNTLRILCISKVIKILEALLCKVFFKILRFAIRMNCTRIIKLKKYFAFNIIIDSITFLDIICFE